MRSIKSYFGNGIFLNQEYCEECNSYSFLDEEGYLVCCGELPSRVTLDKAIIKKNNAQRAYRKVLPKGLVSFILERDENKCYICGCNLKTSYYTTKIWLL